MEYHLFKDVQSYWRWHLKAANGKIIANSGEGYFNKADCVAAINLVKASQGARIVED